MNSRAAKRQEKVLTIPYMQAEGPRCDTPLPVVGTDPEREELRAFWTEALQSTTGAAELLESLRRATCQTHLFPDEIKAEFALWWQHSPADEAVCLACLHVGDTFLLNASGEWFLHDAVQTPPHHAKAEEFFFHEAQGLQQVCLSVPGTVKYRPCVFAHLFAGTRRAGDVQQHLENLGNLGATAISIDIICDVKWGDLLNPETFSMFDKAIRQRILRGFLAGPPCETWTRARAVLSEFYHVRPVRSRVRPYGLCCLTKKESEQVLIGTKLLGVALRLFCTALIFGATAVIEHPSEPHDMPEYASIWRLPIVKFFLKFPQCHLRTLLQGHFGGHSSKPTTFLVAHCAELEQTLVQHRTTRLPKGSSIGREATGEWKTNKLKEYPPDLCKAIALGLFPLSSHRHMVNHYPRGLRLRSKL